MLPGCYFYILKIPNIRSIVVLHLLSKNLIFITEELRALLSVAVRHLNPKTNEVNTKGEVCL